jgi:hypothetical protein
MRRNAALLALALGALLLTPGAAAGLPNSLFSSPPQVTPVLFGTLGTNGWYTTNVTLNWTVVADTVILSTSGCDATTLTSDTAGQTFTCSATSDGGTTTVSKTIKVDKTSPTVTTTPSRPADANGWYSHAVSVSFSGSDATSGVDSCSSTTAYSSPDSANASVTGSCTDKAGNAGTASFGFKYDSTPPTGVTGVPARAPDSNGWYNHALSVSFTGSDGMSGIAGCTQTSYSGPDDGSASVAGTCVDAAGNVSASSAFALEYDAHGPSVTATPSRGADANGWYNHGVSVSFSGTDAVSGGVSCVSPRSYSGPDDAAASVTGSCTDAAGNATSRTFALEYDSMPPVVNATPARSPDSNGWYNRALNVGFAGVDGTSGVASCVGTQSYDGPDSGSAQVLGSCLDNAGNVGTASLPIKYDSSPPTAVVGAAGRSPDANGWYNHAVSVGFSGADQTSGVDTCTQTTYSGPDSGAASVGGTCTDKAGNRSATSAFALEYDAHGPSVTATPSRGADANGWYNHGVSISFSGTDAVSGGVSCVLPLSYSGPDDAAASVTGSCTDAAGNATLQTFGLEYDSRPPVVTATPGRAADSNAWYNHPVTVSFSAVDGLSGVDSCVAPQTYSGPDKGSASVNGSCQDEAGNVGTATFSLAYDSAPPETTATLGRGPDSNGWYDKPVEISFGGTDDASGIAFCTPKKTYSAPDTDGALVTGSCTDKAGNVDAATASFEYDSTAPLVFGAPSRPPDSGGWYNRAVSVSFSGTDGMSGLGACNQTTYSGPDDGTALVGGTCTDKAGNTGTGFLELAYDSTPPVVSATPARAPDSNGWYNRPLNVGFAGADGTSGLASCTGTQSYDGPDSRSVQVAGSCLDNAGNVGTASLPIKYDSTPPTAVVGAAGRSPDANGWYNHAVPVGFSGTDQTSGVHTCTRTTYLGPDTGSAAVAGTCIDVAGNVSALATLGLRYDSHGPSVSAGPARGPDANGWYNHPLTISFGGSDTTSGVAACVAPQTYSGRADASAKITGSCRDRAGNTTPRAFSFRYDATPPSVDSLTVEPGDRTALVRWSVSPDTVDVTLTRSGGTKSPPVTVYRGMHAVYRDRRLTDGIRYRYTVTAVDGAANTAADSADATPTAPLYSPTAGTRLTEPPRLAWKPVPKARYYNVQVWRHGKILSAWPAGASLRLRRAWRFGGRRYRLAPGRYRWYVWPGFGARSAKRYGGMLGSSSFVIVAH